MQDSKVQAYNTLYDKLLKIGDHHIPKFSDSDKQTVLDCITDMSGKYLSENSFAIYVEKDDLEIEKKRYQVSDKEKKTIKQYYQSATELCEAQTAFMQSTRELEKEINDREIFLDIIKQVQMSTVQVNIRTREQEETIKGKMYREMAL